RPIGDGTLNDYKILHFATHGASEGQFGCEESPSALLTSFGEDGSDMLLSFDEIPNLNLDANLVVLSACETESVLGEDSLQLAGGLQPGETLAGLVRAFFSANARAVMATYWEASAAEDSEIFFRTFYSSGRTKSIASSLQDAQTELIQTAEYSHPFYWGPFFVVGNTANGMLAEGTASRAEEESETRTRVAAVSE
ncbi:MAG: CHAT domain-containing protein, partial [Pseudomonadota bacterium]